MALWKIHAGALLPRVYPEDLDKDIDFWLERSNKVIMVGEELYQPRSTVSENVKASDIGSVLDLPRKSEDSGNMPFVAPAPGWTKTGTTINYRLAMRYTEDYLKNDVHGQAPKRVKGLVKAFQQQKMYALWNEINNGTTNTGADGVALFATTHPQADQKQSNWSNLETSAALGHSTLSTMITNAMNMVNEKGYPMQKEIDSVYVAPANWQTIWELVNSPLNPENSTNQKNWLYQKITPKLSHYITSTNDFMGVDTSDKDEIGLIYYQRVAVNFKPLSGADMTTDMAWGRRGKVSFTTLPFILRAVRFNQGGS